MSRSFSLLLSLAVVLFATVVTPALSASLPASSTAICFKGSQVFWPTGPVENARVGLYSAISSASLASIIAGRASSISLPVLSIDPPVEPFNQAGFDAVTLGRGSFNLDLTRFGDVITSTVSINQDSAALQYISNRFKGLTLAREISVAGTNYRLRIESDLFVIEKLNDPYQSTFVTGSLEYFQC